uniref:Uncharacterized protein n=1 Tax=Anguilla anguilla TaxID=7936 RepID=A0A0E9TWJ6_ANGAN
MLQILENRKYEILSNPEVSADIQSLQDIYKNVSAINDQQALKEFSFIDGDVNHSISDI